ncbi:hypothetical protein FRC01_001951 [Tulasnella sp. 417]|nr:hypothetical protein FRC01_001951 [Tulasnella sp. 417]
MLSAVNLKFDPVLLRKDGMGDFVASPQPPCDVNRPFVKAGHPLTVATVLTSGPWRDRVLSNIQISIGQVTASVPPVLNRSKRLATQGRTSTRHLGQKKARESLLSKDDHLLIFEPPASGFMFGLGLLPSSPGSTPSEPAEGLLVKLSMKDPKALPSRPRRKITTGDPQYAIIRKYHRVSRLDWLNVRRLSSDSRRLELPL